jgi:hypothetical protein
VRIDFKCSGGFAHFPGLQRAVQIDTAELSGDDRLRLERLVQQSGFFSLPRWSGEVLSTSPDSRYCVVTVADDRGHQHTIRVDEPILDPALEDLLTELRRQARMAASG